MAPREELLVILDLTSTVLRAGVGVTDLIRGPLLVCLPYPPFERADLEKVF